MNHGSLQRHYELFINMHIKVNILYSMFISAGSEQKPTHPLTLWDQRWRGLLLYSTSQATTGNITVNDGQRICLKLIEVWDQAEPPEATSLSLKFSSLHSLLMTLRLFYAF